MKRYICIVLIVTSALWSIGKGSWTISGNSLAITISVTGR